MPIYNRLMIMKIEDKFETNSMSEIRKSNQSSSGEIDLKEQL